MNLRWNVVLKNEIEKEHDKITSLYCREYQNKEEWAPFHCPCHKCIKNAFNKADQAKINTNDFNKVSIEVILTNDLGEVTVRH